MLTLFLSAALAIEGDQMMRYAAEQWGVLDRYERGYIQAEWTPGDEFVSRFGSRPVARSMVYGMHFAVIHINADRGYSRSCLLRVIMHEMGHAAGVMEHSTSRADVMYHQTQTRGRCSYMLTERDAAMAGIDLPNQPEYLPALMQSDCDLSITVTDELDLVLEGFEYAGQHHNATLHHSAGRWTLHDIQECNL